MIGQFGLTDLESITGVQRMPRLLISNLLGLVGAIVGGVLGFYTFAWLEDKGFYGLAIPGAFLGLGCGLLSQHNSIFRGILCGVAALGLSLFSEWKFHHFLVDNSFSFMVTHITDKSPVTLLMIGIGTVIAFWVGKDGGFRWLPEGSRKPAAESEGDRLNEV